MRQTTRINSKAGLAALLGGSLISVLILTYTSTTKTPLLQTIALLVSMGLLFYSSHPLGHYFVARMFGVPVDYFFLGKSDFRKLKMRPMSTIGNYLPTIGTKLNRTRLESLAPSEKGYVFGAGVILSNILMGIQFAYVLVAGFGLLAVLPSAIFFVGTLVVEFIFSTKVGDLSKMKKLTS